MKLHVILSKNSDNVFDIVVKDIQDIPIRSDDDNTYPLCSLEQLYKRKIVISINSKGIITFIPASEVSPSRCVHYNIRDITNLSMAKIYKETIKYYKSLYESEAVKIGDKVRIYSHTGDRTKPTHIFTIQDIVPFNFPTDEIALNSNTAYICSITGKNNEYRYVCFNVKKINTFKSQVKRHNNHLYELKIEA